MDGKEFSWVSDIQELLSSNTLGYFHHELADGWMDRTDDGHTDIWTEFQVESHLG